MPKPHRSNIKIMLKQSCVLNRKLCSQVLELTLSFVIDVLNVVIIGRARCFHDWIYIFYICQYFELKKQQAENFYAMTYTI